MSLSKEYQRLLNSKEWTEIKRIVWKRANGLCERCKEEGRITQGVDCHHIKPVESAKSPEEMKRLAYDWQSNIRLLCIPCHILTHQEMKSHTKEQVKANKDRELERWIETHRPNYKNNDNGTGTMETDSDDGWQVRDEQLRTGKNKQPTPRTANVDQTEERILLRDGYANQRQAEELEGEPTGCHSIHPEPIRLARG